VHQRRVSGNGRDGHRPHDRQSTVDLEEVRLVAFLQLALANFKKFPFTMESKI
jgi:hypothetical protein